MNKNWLKAPEWAWQPQSDNIEFVYQWVKTLRHMPNPEIIVYGAPLSRSSISVSGASLYPDEFRRMWKKFATYQIEEDVDLSGLKVADAGDVVMHTTDILLSHERIEQVTSFLVETYPEVVTCMVGGDHSVTSCAIRGIKNIYPEEKIGILQLDTHLDVRDPSELGPANGTPIRQLIDGKVVEGKHIVNIGLHGYFNAKSLVAYAKEKQIQMITLENARKVGMKNTIQRALTYLSERVDRIYVTVDMDVLDISIAPGVPASTPGGMSSSELFELLLEIGKHPHIHHLDFVCLDPSKDTIVQETVKIGVYAWLQFMTGYVLEK